MNTDPLSLAGIQDWKRRFAHASNDDEVVRLARELVGALPPQDRVLVGAHDEGHRLQDADDVSEFALRLTQMEMALAWDDVISGTKVRTVARLFIEASKRLGALSEARVLRDFGDGGRQASG
jgi:hypothetical protein